MQSLAVTPTDYLAELPADRIQAMTELRGAIINNLPDGFAEEMSYGMLSYVVPYTIYPNGYHCNPKQALPFMSIASQKNFVAVYHMGIYTDNDLLTWFKEEYGRQSKRKLDMGKSCIRFKKPDEIPFELVGELASKMTPQEWIAIYESQLKK